MPGLTFSTLKQSWLLRIATCVIFGFVVPSRLYCDETRFRNEAPPAWRAYVKALSERAVNDCTVTIESDGKVIREYHVKCDLCYPSATLTLVEDGISTVRFSNQQYSATVASNEGEVWKLDAVDGSMVDGWSQKNIAGLRTTEVRAIFNSARGLTLWMFWLPTLFENPGFRIEQVREIGNLVEVDFKYDHQGDGDANIKGLKGGMLVLDPDNYWMVNSAELDVFWPATEDSKKVGSVRITNDFSPRSSSLNYAKTNETLFLPHTLKGNPISKWIWSSVMTYPRLRPTDERFFLSHYSIAKPVGYKPPANLRRLWIGLARHFSLKWMLFCSDCRQPVCVNRDAGSRANACSQSPEALHLN